MSGFADVELVLDCLGFELRVKSGNLCASLAQLRFYAGVGQSLLRLWDVVACNLSDEIGFI